MKKILTDPVFIFSMGYLVLVSAFLLWHGSWFSPDQFFVAALFIVVVIGRVRQFVQDWSLPLILYFGYEYLRSAVPKLGAVHILPMIRFDNQLLGFIPPIKLQAVLFNGTLRWYDYVAVVLYISHFIVPMLMGFVFWLTSKRYFKDYTIALVALSYAGFITYMLYPAMPPWLASDQGYLPPISRIMDMVLSHFASPVSLPTIYRYFGANLVAAVPSLHAAFPWLTWLFIRRKLKWWSVLALPYVLGVWFAVMYLGEHYLFDVIVGVIYATTVYEVIIHRSAIIGVIKRTIGRKPALHTISP